MKHISNIIMLAVLAVFALSSCTKDSDTGSIVDGEWHTSMTVPGAGEGAAEETVADVYVSFAEGRFVLYQKTGSLRRYYTYTGSFSVTGDLLTGNYDDGEPLCEGAGYEVSVDGSTLTMTALNGSEEISVYTKVTIPSEVRDSAVPHVKSVEAAPAPLL